MLGMVNANRHWKIRASLALICLIMIQGCSPSCSDEHLSSYRDDQSGFYAFKFSRNCGATVSNNVQIAISQLEEGYNNDENVVFVADSGEAKDILEPLNNVDISWSSGKLLIDYDKRMRIFRKSNHSHVDIEFNAR